MSVRKRAAGTAASPDLDTPDTVKKRKKNDVSNPVSSTRSHSRSLLLVAVVVLGRSAALSATWSNVINIPCRGILESREGRTSVPQ